METTQEQIRRSRAEFRENERKKIAAMQAECKHPVVGHSEGNEGFTLLNPKRVCMSCGLEETGSWWSYSGSHWLTEIYDEGKLGNSQDREIRKITREELYKLRLLSE